MAKKVAPSGLPRCRSVSAWPCSLDSDVLSRNSWVMAMPMEAKARLVRSQARKVRSVLLLCCVRGGSRRGGGGEGRVEPHSPNAKWSRATLPLFSSSMLWKYASFFFHALGCCGWDSGSVPASCCCALLVWPLVPDGVRPLCLLRGDWFVCVMD